MDLMAGFLDQLGKSDGGEITESQINFKLAVVKGLKPRDQIEAMLAAQMATVHTAAMKFSRIFAETAPRSSG